MFSRISRSIWQRAVGGVAAICLFGGAASTAKALDSEVYSLSLGFDYTSHFVSYGADVWGGGKDCLPCDPQGTKFAYGTLTAKFTDQISGFVNVWADINNNADSDIGGSIQEVDLNIGGTYTWDKFSFTLANGCWWYAGDTEHILDFVVAYNDADMFMKGFALNPSFTVHHRYEGNGDQDKGTVLVGGIRPSYTFLGDTQYPLTLFAPMSVAWHTEDYHGGDDGFGYYSVGAGVSVPLAFIPEKFGAWSMSATAIYYCTDHEVIPGNPDQDFIVTALSIGVSI